MPDPDSHWRSSAAPLPDCPPLTGAAEADVAIVGAGYAGLNAALELAERHGTAAVVLEAAQPGWGASGRNGGFCCLGGAMIGGAQIARRHGAQAARDWSRYERAAIERVRDNLARYRIDAEAGPEGEVKLAHNPRAMAALRAAAQPGDCVLEVGDLAARGLGGRFHGGLLSPAGFPLHPLKYARGLAEAAQRAGVRLHGGSAVTGLQRDGQGWRLATAGGVLRARRVLWATNAYSPEPILPWLRGRILPVTSAILVTRPVTAAEQAAQGWTSQVMAYDSRRVLHYFRLLPCGRFLFGGRGSASARPAAQAAFEGALRADFEALFPAWKAVPTERYWSGLVCLTGSALPWLGAVPGQPGLFVAMGWHGNGVAAASEGGRRIAAALVGADRDCADDAEAAAAGAEAAGAEAAVPPVLARRPRPVMPPVLRPLALRAGITMARLLDGPLR